MITLPLQDTNLFLRSHGILIKELGALQSQLVVVIRRMPEE